MTIPVAPEKLSFLTQRDHELLSYTARWNYTFLGVNTGAEHVVTKEQPMVVDDSYPYMIADHVPMELQSLKMGIRQLPYPKLWSIAEKMEIIDERDFLKVRCYTYSARYKSNPLPHQCSLKSNHKLATVYYKRPDRNSEWLVHGWENYLVNFCSGKMINKSWGMRTIDHLENVLRVIENGKMFEALQKVATFDEIENCLSDQHSLQLRNIRYCIAIADEWLEGARVVKGDPKSHLELGTLEEIASRLRKKGVYDKYNV